MTKKEVDCLFCSCKAFRDDKLTDRNIKHFYNCPNCENYQTDDLSESIYLVEILSDPKNKAILSYVINRMYQKNHYHLIDLSIAKQIVENNNLPSVAEQADNFIIWLGNELNGAGDEFHLEFREYYTAHIGALNKNNFDFILSYLKDQRLINTEGRDEIISLTF